MDENILTLTHATERDIDLILVEEFKCSQDFVTWIVQKTWPGVKITDWQVVHSKRRTHNRREIDICLNAVSSSDNRFSLLIENKLDAADQPLQAESYREEAELLIRNGVADNVATIVVCPAAYSKSNASFIKRFDHLVTYEQIAQFFQARAASIKPAELAMRLKHHSDLIVQAIDKKRRGYVAVPIKTIGGFNQEYVSVCMNKYPKLLPGPSMLRTANPGESVTMIFASTVLPNQEWLPQTRIVHQLRERNANINFYTWGDAFEVVAEEFSKDLRGTGFTISASINRRKGGKSGLMVCCSTPQVDNQRSFSDQRDVAVEGMAATERLRQWFQTNQPLLRKLASTIDGVLGE